MFVLTEGALNVTPGPAVLFVVSQGLRRGSNVALSSAVGILAANACYFAVSGTGVGALLVASGSIFTLAKWAGAGYLLYLGAIALLRPPLPDATSSRTVADSGPSTHFLRGFLLQLSNPKSLLFFMAILPQFIDRSRPIAPQIIILGVTSVVLEFVVLAAYGAGAARVGMQPRFAIAASRMSGIFLVGAALGLARSGR